MGMLKLTAIGNVGSDPEFKTAVVTARNALYAGGAVEVYVLRVREALSKVGIGHVVESALRCLGDETKLEALLFDALKDRRMT